MPDADVLSNWATASTEEVRHLGCRFVADLISREVPARRHPLGFWHVTERWADHEVRLHLWVPGYSVQNNSLMIHDHIFEVQSRVLAGQVVDVGYQVREASRGPLALYEVSYGDKTSELKELSERVEAIEVHRSVVTQWQSYRVAVGQFHRTEVEPDSFAATLVVPVASSVSAPRVVGTGGVQSVRFERSEVSFDELRPMLERLLKELRRQ